MQGYRKILRERISLLQIQSPLGRFLLLIQTKHGAASACYRPISTDPFPNDAQVLVLVGGSTLNNVYYPPDSMTASNGFEVLVPGSTNTVTQGTLLTSQCCIIRQ
jgi:hypothetical protein